MNKICLLLDREEAETMLNLASKTLCGSQGEIVAGQNSDMRTLLKFCSRLLSELEYNKEPEKEDIDNGESA